MPKEWIQSLAINAVAADPGPSAALRVPPGVDLVGVQAVFRFTGSSQNGMSAQLQGTMAHIVVKNVVQPPTDPNVWESVIDGFIAIQLADASGLMGAAATNLTGLGPWTFVRLLPAFGATPPDDGTLTLYLNGAFSAEEG
jgi:hypothetical protein